MATTAKKFGATALASILLMVTFLTLPVSATDYSSPEGNRMSLTDQSGLWHIFQFNKCGRHNISI